MEGFLVFDYMKRAPDAVMGLWGLVQTGQIVNQVDMEEGLENAPATLRRLFRGDNRGKQLLKIADCRAPGTSRRTEGAVLQPEDACC
jgi:NADPH-dependent curcumin reductase